MADPSSNDTFEPGEIRFVDSFVPSLAAGDYTIQVEHTLKGSGAYQVDRKFTEMQAFTVRGPRFNLDPSDIYATFPPANSQGTFGNDLPHVVLTRRTLPWERDLFDDKTKTPWMALLLFEASEILPPVVGSNAGTDTPSPTRTSTITVENLVNPQIPEPYTFQAYTTGTIDKREMAQSCQVFDISPETFRAVMPSQEDARYLTHCRVVSLASKGVAESEQPDAALASDAGRAWYSVVIGGRFPSYPAPGQAGKLYVAYLVSLEGFEDFLKDPRNAQFPPGTTRVRLVSLASWTFTCLSEEGENFGKLMLGLAAEARTGTAHEFRLPTPPLTAAAHADEAFVFRVLEAGYVPCSYQTRPGKTTFAWYRGPFTPQQVPPFPPDREPFVSSAQAIVYDQEHGLFDLSYAVAWETGRLLALSDQRFGLALLNWWRKASRVQLSVQSGSGGLAPGVAATRRLDMSPGSSGVGDTAIFNLWGRFAAGITLENVSSMDKVPPQAGPMVVAAGGSVQGGTVPYEVQGAQQAGSEELNSIYGWLTHLHLLYGVPFINLVPDERLLPPESIRFFYLDPNWLEIMLEGALSIGIQSSKDRFYRDTLYKGLRERIHDLRSEGSGQGPLTGLLLRSAVVSGWPGLEMRAYASSNGVTHAEQQVGLLRMDRPSEDVLLCLFDQAPAWIEFDEPKEGLHFGIDDVGKITLRHLKGEDVGRLTGTSVAPECDQQTRRLNIQDLRTRIAGALGLSDGNALRPADLALQMVKAPEQMVFQRASEGGD